MAHFFILEDNPERMDLLTPRLLLAGHTYDHAADVETARGIFAPPYDALLLDHDLGGDVYVESNHANTGAAFTRHLKTLSLAPVPVIVHTWNPVGGIVMTWELQRAGFTDITGVPFNSPGFWSALARWGV